MTNKSVPQTKPTQQEFDFNRVRLEPDLQMQVATYTPAQRRATAKVFIRWAHQLEISARVLESQRVPWKRRSLPRISCQARQAN